MYEQPARVGVRRFAFRHDLAARLVSTAALALALLAALAATDCAVAQPAAPAASTPTMPPAPVAAYGPAISLDDARRVAAAAQTEMSRQGVKAAIAIVDPSGELVWFERADDTQTGSLELSRRKAVAAAIYRRSTMDYLESLRSGNLGVLTLGVVASPGGNPLVLHGKVVGAIGVSGGAGMEDAQIAAAGVAALR